MECTATSDDQHVRRTKRPLHHFGRAWYWHSQNAEGRYEEGAERGMHDFKTQKTKIEELIAKHGHRVSEIPLWAQPHWKGLGSSEAILSHQLQLLVFRAWKNNPSSIGLHQHWCNPQILPKSTWVSQGIQRWSRSWKWGGQEVEKAVKLYNSHSPQHTQPQEIYNKFNKDSCSYKHCQYRYTCLGCGQHHPVTCCPTRPGGYSANFYSCEDSPRQPRCNQQRTGQRV